MEREYKDLSLIYPEDSMISKNYEISRIELTQDGLDALKNKNCILNSKYIEHFVIGKKYLSLIKRGEGVMMSTHPSETMTNQDFINKASGDVLIFGLGLGMIVFPLILDDDIKSITIIESDIGVIDMVGKIIKENDLSDKVKIINDNAFSYYENLSKEDNFDTIYFDIWIKIDENAFTEMEKLHSIYKNHKRHETSYIDSWCYFLKEEYMNLKTEILVDNGDMFDGTREQFMNCFFSNANDEEIKDWCLENGFSLKINDKIILQ